MWVQISFSRNSSKYGYVEFRFFIRLCLPVRCVCTRVHTGWYGGRQLRSTRQPETRVLILLPDLSIPLDKTVSGHKPRAVPHLDPPDVLFSSECWTFLSIIAYILKSRDFAYKVKNLSFSVLLEVLRSGGPGPVLQAATPVWFGAESQLAPRRPCVLLLWTTVPTAPKCCTPDRRHRVTRQAICQALWCLPSPS